MLHVSLWFFFVEMTVFKRSEAKWNCFIALFFIFFIFTTFSFNVSSNLLVTKEKCVNSLHCYILKWWIIVAVFWTVQVLYWFLSPILLKKFYIFSSVFLFFVTINAALYNCRNLERAADKSLHPRVRFPGCSWAFRHISWAPSTTLAYLDFSELLVHVRSRTV